MRARDRVLRAIAIPALAVVAVSCVLAEWWLGLFDGRVVWPEDEEPGK